MVDVPVYRSCIFPCRGAEAGPHGLAVQQTIVTPQFRVDKVVDAPVLQVLLLPHVVHTPVVAQGQFSVVLRTMEIPQLLQFDKVSSSLLCRLCSSTGAGCGGDSRDPSGRRHPCRDAEAVSLGPGCSADH